MNEPVYRIKPLAWVQSPIFTSCSARSVFGPIVVMMVDDLYEWSCGPDSHSCDSIEGGKEKAEAWYRAKLLEALEEVR